MATKKNVVFLTNYARRTYTCSDFFRSHHKAHMTIRQLERSLKVHQHLIKNVCYTPTSAIVTLTNGKQAEAFIK